jgi:drug/metabolite transporter (DMT)-like permease
LSNAKALDPLQPVLALLGASILWGLTWLPLKYFGSHGVAGVTVTLVAHGSVGALALPWLILRRRQFQHRLLLVLLLALLGGTANLTFAVAIVRGDVVRMMVLFYLLPAWGVLGGRLVLGEAIDGQRWLSVASALGGAFLVLGGFHVWQRPLSLVDLMAVVSGMTLAFNNVLFRKLADVPVPEKMGAMFAGCLLVALALTLLGVQHPPSGVPSIVWLQLSGFGLVWIALATIGTLYGVAHLEASRSSILIIVELLTAVASAAILSQRELSTLEWAGAALIVIAAVLEAWRPNQESGAAS